jgi:hypothetical protein
MTRYFIKEGAEPYKEVSTDEYEKTAKEAHLNNFHHSVPSPGRFGRYIHIEIIGRICDTHEQIEALLSNRI